MEPRSAEPIQGGAAQEDNIGAGENVSRAIPVFVSVTCNGDNKLQGTIRQLAEKRLRTVKMVTLVENMDEASILLSFSGIRVPADANGTKERVAYSFAYGTPEIEFVGDDPIALPRYIYHEAVVSPQNELTGAVDANIRAADMNFIGILREAL